MIPQLQKSVFVYQLINSLNNYDYGDKFVRYVTFKSREKKSFFGTETENGFAEKLEGKIIRKAWNEIADKFPGCILGDQLLKPDSFNGIIMLDKTLTAESRMKTYLKIISYFKNRSTILMNKLHGTFGRVFWENRYEEIAVSDIYSLREVLSFLKKPQAVIQ